MIVVGGGTPNMCEGNGGGGMFVGPLTLDGIRTSPGIECGAGVNVGIGVVVIWTFGSGFGDVAEVDDDVEDEDAD